MEPLEWRKRTNSNQYCSKEQFLNQAHQMNTSIKMYQNLMVTRRKLLNERLQLVATIFICISSVRLASSESLEEPEASQSKLSSLDSNALLYLQKYGYMGARSSGATNQLISEESYSNAIIEFQRFAGLPATGLADNETIELMHLPRCGNPDKSATFKRRRKRYALQGSKWRRQLLTYRISQYPTRFSGKRSEVDTQIERAFGIWSQVAPIDFVVKHDGRVHIDIRFASGDHGDGDAFDGPGNTLAHAYFPQYGGDAHFDDQEYWTIDSTAGTNIFQVAAHELGHSLGLGHSNVREALMAPFYQKYKPNFRLHADDVLAIQALYGEKPTIDPVHTSSASLPTSTTSTPSTTQNAPSSTSQAPGAQGRFRPTTDSDQELCTNSAIDAITRTEDGRSYVFRGDFYWLLTNEGLAPGYPRPITADWDGLPGRLDAALTWADGKTFFFKGNKYWRFRNKRRDVGYPKLISVGFAGIPDDIDAAFVWAGNGRTYIFKGSQYWRFDSKAEPPVAAEYPRSIRVWTGVPSHLDAAFKWDNNVTYFFKGQNYYRFNDQQFRVETRGRPPFPRPTGAWWFGCAQSGQLRPAPVAPAASLKARPMGLTGELASMSQDWALVAASLDDINRPLGTHISDQKPEAATERRFLSRPAIEADIEQHRHGRRATSSAISANQLHYGRLFGALYGLVCLLAIIAHQQSSIIATN